MAFDVKQSNYVALREAALPDTSRLVVWCGAGLSKPANIPTWSGLRQALEGRLLEKAGYLGAKERESIEKRINAFRRQKIQNYWVVFEFLKRELGDTSYRQTIREVLSPGATAPVPAAYHKLWQLRLAGILSLNLDPLALRAYQDVHPGPRLVTFPGNKIGENTHVLRNPNSSFLCQIHGLDTDATTWVFTQQELSALMKEPSYLTFISSILTTFTVLFIGLSVDDIAVGGHLKRLVDQKTDFGAHFWVTDRNDPVTAQWAESAAIRTIFYRADDDHTELQEMLDDIVSYVPRDDRSTDYPPALYGSSLSPSSSLPPPEEVRRLEPEEIRTVLNRRALDILRLDNPNREQDFAAFLDQYAYPIHNAWFVSTTEGENSLVGYTLKERRNKGAFGQIYKAKDKEGKAAAIKLLKDEVRTDPHLLHSFRRGVQAMRILSSHNVSGMVAYKEASEIPAFVAMDWIDGYDLRQAVDSGLLDTWEQLIQVALKIALILKSAHSLPERVLHRDLRPANIMLKRKKDNRPWEVFLLDFDLSWYLGSIEQSVIHGSDAYGYLAPEQIHQKDGMSSRHPAVDSYGLGMTLYYAISKVNPVPSQHLHLNWETEVLQIAVQRQRAAWASVAKRYARLIINLTSDRQAMRWDLAQTVLELKRMLVAIKHPAHVRFEDMLAEELVARSSNFNYYEWDADKQAAIVREQQAGISLAVTGDDGNHCIELRIEKVRTATDERWKGQRRFPEKKERISEILRSGGWSVRETRADLDYVLFTAKIDVESVAQNLDKTSAIITQVQDAIFRI